MNAGVFRDGGVMSIDFLKVGTALSLAIFWVMVLLFLQSIIVGFAVFVGGVVYVLKRLRSFLFSLAIILFMFAQIFFTLYVPSIMGASLAHSSNLTSFCSDTAQ